MFERYTEKARRVIFFARYEASQYGSPSIETEHLLLGLMREDRTLANLFIRTPIESIRKEIESRIEIRERISTAVEMPLSEECERILNYASEEAEKLNHKHVGTEHLLLAILREDHCFAARILQAHEVTLSRAREEATHSGRPREAIDDSDVDVGIPEWQQQGIPKGYGFAQLLFNPPTGTLVVEVCHGTGKRFLPNRLFWRRKDSDRYEPLGQPEGNCSQESAVTSLAKPVLFFNSKRITQHEESRASGEWDSLYSVDLETLTVVRYASKETLSLPPPYNDCWVTRLLSISNDGGSLYLTIGMCENNGTSRLNIAYHLAELDINTKRLRTVALLRATFF
jgi:Clp amino terminal domain, pathogenicity island component